MAIVEITLGLLLCVALVAALGKWIPLPLPLLQIVAGGALAFSPAFRGAAIPPEVFFVLFIPPLLFADGWLISKRDLLQSLRPVVLLAFGLVLMTVLTVGLLMNQLIPALPLAAAFVLAAVISPTDAVAVSAIIGRLRIPARVTTIIGGESLLNDASGLIAFKFAAAAVVTGVFSWTHAAGQFVLEAGGGLLLGVVVAWAIRRVRIALARLRVGDPSIQTVILLLTPYAAYLAAEAAGVGGILAVVAAGLYAGSHAQRHLDAATRAHSVEVASMVLFVFNGLVFVLMGIELHSVLSGATGSGLAQLLTAACVLWAVMTALRLLWVFPGIYIPLFLSRRLRKREGMYSPGEVFLVGWGGIRGSVTLAAALSIPLTTAGGSPFPGRDLIIVLAASAIVATILLNGLTLPLFARWLKIRGDGIAEREERAARLATTQAIIDELSRSIVHVEDPDQTVFVTSLIDEFARRLQRLSANDERRHELEEIHAAQRHLLTKALGAGRAKLLAMRTADEINDEVLRRLQAEFDVQEALIIGTRRDGH